MKKVLELDIHHLTRVEGHGNILVRVEEGRLKEARWDVVETPRYFEAMLKGKHYTSAPVIASRICGICSIAHCLASLRASEAALGATVPETPAKLRLLAKHGETLQSHYLHVLFLAAPDFLGLPSFLPLLETRPEIVAMAVRLRGMANRLCDAVAGRTTHPISLQVGGVAMMPDPKVLEGLRQELTKSLDDLATIVDIFGTFEIPVFSRETEFVSLKAENGYAWLGGKLFSSDGVVKEEHEYRAMTNEYVDDNNTSKWTKLSRDSFAVGALARFNNNQAKLHPAALEAAEALGLEPVCHNPFMNNVAQIVECVHCTHESIRLIEEIVGSRPGELMAPVRPGPGQGVGAVEAPRGILYHDYEYDGAGRIVKANCVIPTTQNNANIHHDLRDLVARYAEQGADEKKLELLCSMLVRAYDPCISCSVH